MLGKCATNGWAWGVALGGDKAYVAADEAGLRVISVADAANPVEVGHYDMPGWVNGVTAVGGYAYVAYGENGLQIFQYYGVGVEESPGQQVTSHKLAATVVRSLPQGAVAFDALGRRVVNPKPGVYFVSYEPSAVSRQPTAVTKVIISR